MKQKDLPVILVVAIISVVVSILVSKVLFSSAKTQQTVQVVPTISAAFPQPSSQYFNSQSINPTQLITIGPSNNATPFNAPSQQ